MRAAVDEILIESDAAEYRAAAVADGKLVDLAREPVDRRLVPGTVHLARVGRVVPQIGAFLDHADGFRSLLDIAGSRTPGQGDLIRVQIVEAPAGEKLARAATRITLAGRHAVLVPGGKGVSVSKRTAVTKREALQELAGSLHRAGEGLVLRAGAAYAEVGAVAEELERLRAMAEGLAAEGDVPRMLLADDPFVTLLRTLAPQDKPDFFCDRAETALAARLGLKGLFPDVAGRVAHLRDGGAIFERHGIADILVTLGLVRVNLDNGAWLSIEPTAALVAVDVNLGRATQEPVSVNIVAAREVARQVRLRDLGGLVAVDFLRLSKPGERARVIETLKRATAFDRKRVDVLGYTAGGTVEFTRARSRGGSLD